MTNHPDLFTALAAPFERGQVKTRPQGGKQLAYVTARTIMNRLDGVLGPENWWDDYTPLEHSVICRLTIRLPDGQVVTKSDAGAYAGMADPGDDDKSGFADAFKRAAVKFGVSRYLYQDGVATLTSPAASPPSPAVPALAAESTPSVKSERPRTGLKLDEYAQACTIDPCLKGWIVAAFTKQGYPARISAWTPAQVEKAWPAIRQHLVDMKKGNDGLAVAS